MRIYGSVMAAHTTCQLLTRRRWGPLICQLAVLWSHHIRTRTARRGFPGLNVSPIDFVISLFVFFWKAQKRSAPKVWFGFSSLEVA